MFSKQYGSGPNHIIAYHGWAGTHRDFAAVGRLLPEGWTLIAPDLPGYGSSPALERVTEEPVVDALERHLNTIPCPEVTLCGYCSGAVLALLVAERAPERVKRLVLIDPFAYVPWYFRIFVLGEFGRRAYYTTFASRAGRRVTEWVLSRRRTPDRGFMTSFTSVQHDVVLAYLHLFARVGTPERFRSLQMPVDLCYGERTFAAVRRSIAAFQHVWPHARTHCIPASGHLIMLSGARHLASVLGKVNGE